MAENIRGNTLKLSNGPYLAVVTNHLDPTYMGSLEVAVLKPIPGMKETQSSNVIVKYCSPFFGNTPEVGGSSADSRSTQKSYGFWMVPPDIGATVMVMFIDGDINQGYWFGCVPDLYQNYMTPGIAASKFVAISPEEEAEYGTKYLPVTEYHKKTRDMKNQNPDASTKPIHPFAKRLKQQGLLLDNVRGVTSSSARREVPSMVFGISTPGPIDTSNGSSKEQVGHNAKTLIPVSRLGGTQFIMDDGDKDGQNELVRIRTRTGHQILLHNSSDLIYIANSKGTAWVELTSNGKIDIYAQDSISIHSENDFNFRAGRDINLEAGRNINVNANSGIEINCVDRFYLICDNNGKIQISQDLDLQVGDELRLSTGGKTNIISGGEMFLNSAAAMNQTATDWRVSASGGSNISSSEHRESAGRIEMNGPAATPANAGAPAQTPDKLVKFNLPSRSSSAGWANANFYRDSDIVSIMQRVPTHEPWDQHENINPDQFSPASTNVQVNQPGDVKAGPTAESGAVPTNGNPTSQPLSKNAKQNEAYLQSILIQAGYTDPIKLAAVMAQCKVESDNFRALREYASGAEYEGRKDLGNTQPGDGVKYKGRGFIQCTGRDNYASMSKFFKQDFVNQPERVETVEWAAKSVTWFFDVYKKGRTTTVNWDDCVAVTKIVNGGTNGLAKRQQYYAEYKAKFTTQGIAPEGTVSTGSGGTLVDSSGAPVKTGG